MTSPCWNCLALTPTGKDCGLCGSPYMHAASIRLTTIAEMEAEWRGYLGSVARLANSALKHGERELSVAAAATEKQVAATLRSLREQRDAVKRDVVAQLAARPALAVVP